MRDDYVLYLLGIIIMAMGIFGILFPLVVQRTNIAYYKFFGLKVEVNNFFQRTAFIRSIFCLIFMHGAFAFYMGYSLNKEKREEGAVIINGEWHYPKVNMQNGESQKLPVIPENYNNR